MAGKFQLGSRSHVAANRGPSGLADNQKRSQREQKEFFMLPSSRFTLLAAATAATLAMGCVSMASATVLWSDNFSGVTATQTVTINSTSTNGGQTFLTPAGDPDQYNFYAGGALGATGATDTTTLSAEQNAVGSDPGLVYANVSGGNVSYGGFSILNNSQSPYIGITLSGWTAGNITSAMVSSLVLTFNYTSSFSSSTGPGDFSANFQDLNGNAFYGVALTPETSGTTATVSMANAPSNFVSDLVTNLNNLTPEDLSLSFQPPTGSGSVPAGSTFAVSDLAVSGQEVPEPTALGLLVLASAALLLGKRRRA